MLKMNTKYILIVCFYVIILKHGPEAKNIDWCSLDCITQEGNIKNTMCTYAVRKSTSSCNFIRDTNAPETIKEILHLHNKFRSIVAGGDKGWPSAANMRQMTWDPALEAVALRWAQQCIPEHDKCRRTPEFHTVGQNYCGLANWQYYENGPKHCFKGWAEGIYTTTAKILGSFNGGVWARFTQTVWAESYKLGCAQVHFRQAGRGILWRKTVLVCNYGPGGNIISKKIYEPGDPCSRCPNNTSCRPASTYPKLCARPEDPMGPTDIIDDNLYNTPDAKGNGAGITATFKFESVWSLLTSEPKYNEMNKMEKPPAVCSLVLIPMVVLIPIR